MIDKRMRVSMAVTLGMLFVMLAFGRGRLAPFYDDVGKAATEAITAALRQDHRQPVAREQGDGEAPGRPHNDIPTSRAADVAPRTNPAANPPQESTTHSGELAEREVPAAELAALPDPQAVRDSAVAEVEALGPLYDELVEVLEAIQEAQTDRLEKRWAGDRVTMARFAKRHDLQNLRLPLAGAPEWRVRSARGGAAHVRARLNREIAEARETLAKLRRH